MSKPDNFTTLAKRNRCPKCKETQVYVVDKRNKRGTSPQYDSSRRRRHCRKCGHRWTTFEIHETVHKMFIKIIKVSNQRLKAESANELEGEILH